MDDSSHRRRQNEPPYTRTDPRFNAGQGTAQGRGFSSSSAEAFRTAPLTASPTAGRASGGAAAYSGYYPEPQAAFPAALPSNPLQYQSAYPQDQRQQQSFPNYNQDLMYNVAPQAPQGNVYDSSQQFQPRQPAAMHLLSDVAAPYFPNEPTSAPGPPTLQHHASSGSSAVYQHQQSPGDRASMLQQGYTGAMTMGGMAQPAAEVLDEEEFQVQGAGPGTGNELEHAYTTYQTALKGIFQNIRQGRLAVAAESLLDISEWLLGHVVDLGGVFISSVRSYQLIDSDQGLTVDEVTLHSDRIRLWKEFNTAWLGIFLKQKDLLESGQRIQPPQSLMTQEYINKMAKDLIRMCDAVEKHGLVDYQYGVEEERIMMSKSQIFPNWIRLWLTMVYSSY